MDLTLLFKFDGAQKNRPPVTGFPQNRFQMNLYYDGECFIYTDGTSKFIVHPNYKMKVSRELVANVNFITATRVKDPAEFTLPKYRKI